jgi:3-deoxy-7-phosphoheptulonate synthase
MDNLLCNIPLSTSSKKYKLAGRHAKPEGTIVHARDVAIGGSQFTVMAGPCAVESRDQLLTTAEIVKGYGASVLRGGAFKPRSSPYSFQGMEEEGLKLLAEAREKTGLPIVTEVMDTRLVDLVIQYADILQIGSRSMQNFPLLKEVGKTEKPILFKRGMGSSIDEYLLAAEHILHQGNENVILCERGIRTFETSTRNTLDLNAIPMLKHLSHLPVIVDPSHGTGVPWMVAPLSRAAMAAGADGLLVEVHYQPEKALCDGQQSLSPDQFADMMHDLRLISTAMGKDVTSPEMAVK